MLVTDIFLLYALILATLMFMLLLGLYFIAEIVLLYYSPDKFKYFFLISCG